MQAAALNENLSLLMNKWKCTHQENGYTHFIYDGVVDAERYLSSPLKVCFLLKECYLTETDVQNDVKDYENYLLSGTYPENHHWIKHIRRDGDDYTYSLVNNLRDDAPWYMWNRVKVMADTIFHGAQIEMENQSPLHSIAVVDIKKSNGLPSSDFEDILRYAKEDRELIEQELLLLDSKVIVCGGTLDICLASGLIPRNELKEICAFAPRSGLRKAYQWESRIILDTWHPSARFNYESFKSAYAQQVERIHDIIG